MSENVLNPILLEYTRKVLDARAEDIKRAERRLNNTSQGTESPPSGSTNSVAGAKFTSPQGGGNVVLPIGNRQEYQKMMLEILDTSKLIPVNSSYISFTNGASQNFFQPDFARHLEKFALVVTQRLGTKQIVISSGYRDPAHNQAVGGKKYSDHMLGIAVDIASSGNPRYTIADLAFYYGFGGIAIGQTFVHIDTSVRTFWAYPGVPKYTGP